MSCVKSLVSLASVGDAGYEGVWSGRSFTACRWKRRNRGARNGHLSQSMKCIESPRFLPAAETPKIKVCGKDPAVSL